MCLSDAIVAVDDVTFAVQAVVFRVFSPTIHTHSFHVHTYIKFESIRCFEDAAVISIVWTINFLIFIANCNYKIIQTFAWIREIWCHISAANCVILSASTVEFWSLSTKQSVDAFYWIRIHKMWNVWQRGESDINRYEMWKRKEIERMDGWKSELRILTHI